MTGPDPQSSEAASRRPSSAPSFGQFAIVLAAALAVYYGDVLLGFSTFYYRDFGLFGYPLAQYHRESFWRGEIPFWNPYSLCGVPFLAQWNTLVLYPGSLIYLLLPLPWSLCLFSLIHLYWGGLGMYRWAHQSTRCPLGAGIAGLAYALGGILINSLMWPNNIAALAWMPWMVLAAERAWRRPGRSLVPAIVVGGVQMLTGAPEMILFTWVILGVLGLGETDGRGWQDTARRLAVLAGIGLGSLVLALPQLVPFLDLLQHSHRSEAFNRDTWAMPWNGWAMLLLPLFRTLVNLSGITFQAGQYWTNSYYAGIGTLFLALVAVARVRHRRARLLLILCLTGMALALGNKAHLLPWAERVLLPLTLVRYPIKYVVLTVFALPALAAFGTRWFLDPHTPERQVRRTALLLGGALVLMLQTLVWIQGASARPGENWDMVFSNAWTRAVLLATILGLLLLVRRRPQGSQRLLSTALLGLWALGLLSAQPNQHPAGPPRLLDPIGEIRDGMSPPPELGRGRAMTESQALVRVHFRDGPSPAENFLIWRLGLVGNANLLDHIPTTQGFFSLYPLEMNRLRMLSAAFTNVVDCPFLDLLGVSQVTRPSSDLEWLHRPTALPLLTIGLQPVIASDSEGLAVLLSPDYRPGEQIHLPPEAADHVPDTASTTASILSAAVTAQAVRAEVETAQPTLLRVTQTYDPNWIARVDGKPTPVLRADTAFQAVRVPAGRCVVELRYRPRGFAAALAMSGLFLAALLIVATGAAGRDRSKPPAPAPPVA